MKKKQILNNIVVGILFVCVTLLMVIHIHADIPILPGGGGTNTNAAPPPVTNYPQIYVIGYKCPNDGVTNHPTNHMPIQAFFVNGNTGGVADFMASGWTGTNQVFPGGFLYVLWHHACTNHTDWVGFRTRYVNTNLDGTLSTNEADCPMPNGTGWFRTDFGPNGPNIPAPAPMVIVCSLPSNWSSNYTNYLTPGPGGYDTNFSFNTNSFTCYCNINLGGDTNTSDIQSNLSNQSLWYCTTSGPQNTNTSIISNIQQQYPDPSPYTPPFDINSTGVNQWGAPQNSQPVNSVSDKQAPLSGYVRWVSLTGPQNHYIQPQYLNPTTGKMTDFEGSNYVAVVQDPGGSSNYFFTNQLYITNEEGIKFLIYTPASNQFDSFRFRDLGTNNPTNNLY